MAFATVPDQEYHFPPADFARQKTIGRVAWCALGLIHFFTRDSIC
jgi:hypothetical protein